MNTRPALVVALVALTACGSSPTSPAIASLAGTWTGTGISTVQQPSRVFPIRVTFVQSAATLAGSYVAGTESGQVIGTIDGATVTATLQPSQTTNCPTTVRLTLAGTGLSGSYAAIDCGPDVGAVELTKQ